MNGKLNKEKQEIKEKLNDKNASLDEYKNESDILDYRHKQKIQEIEKELNDKGISLNKLNNIYEQKNTRTKK